MSSEDHGQGYEAVLPLSHSQFSYLWLYSNDMAPVRRPLSYIACTVSIPRACGPDGVAAAFEVLMRRHQGLRSRIGWTADWDPVQYVHPEPPLPLVVEDVLHDADRLPEVLERICSAPPTMLAAPSFRVHVIPDAEGPAYACLIVNHLFIDRTTAMQLTEEIDRVLANVAEGRDPEHGLVPAGTLQDRVRHERSERGAKRAEAARRYWRELFDAVPDCSFPFHHRFSVETARQGHTRIAKFRSAALAAALRWTAETSAVSPCTTLMAAATVLLADYCDSALTWSMPVAQGSPAPGKLLLECRLQKGYALLDPRGETEFSASLPAAAHSVLRGQRHAQYSFAHHLTDLRSAAIARGAGKHVEVNINCMIGGVRDAIRVTAPERIGELRSASRLSAETVEGSLPHLGFIVRLDAVRQEVHVELWHTHDLLPEPDADRLLYGIEDIIVAFAADGEVDLRRVRARNRDAGWPRRPEWRALADGRHLDERAMETVALAVPGVRSASLDIAGAGVTDAAEATEAAGVTGATGVTVTVDVEPSSGVDADALLDHYHLALSHPGVLLPSRIVVRHTRPMEGAGAAESEDTAVRHAGARAALEKAMARVNQWTEVDPRAGYLEQGGRVERLPALRYLLATDGWAGLSYEALMSGASVRTLARRLTRAVPAPVPGSDDTDAGVAVHW
ncbi:condensation domain-containing protein [Streptomyces sp. URMC 123]|uniref:condensation domain-containing protein n=1 Tax=Streptomyces sp. URMC 123 TaxID=3423403 RepID=UPI003F1AA362